MKRISQKVSRLLCLMLAMVMLLGMLPISAFATETTENPQPRAAETRYIGFTSDVHDEFDYLEDWMTNVKNKFDLEHMVFGGDYTYEADLAYGGVGTAAAGAAAFNTVVNLVKSVFGSGYGIYTAGNHEYDNNYITQIQNTSGFKRIGLAAQHTPYEIFCFGAYDEDSVGYFAPSDITTLQNYLNGVRDDVPIFIVSHYPLHAWKSSSVDRETTNAGQVIDLLNQHPNVIFFWGHNHSQGDTNYGKVMKAGDSITYNKSGSKKTINFTYANIGCMCGSRQPYFGVVAGVNNGGESVSLTYYNVSGTSHGTTNIQIVECIHDYGTPTYTWTGITQCAATRVCKNDTSHTEVATAARINSQVTTPAGCETKGVTTYTAVFNESWAQNQTKELENINATGHSWKDTAYEWSADNSECTAVRECRNDAAHPMTETVDVTSKVTKEAVCGNKGTTTYTADFTAEWAQDQTKAVDDIPAPGKHDFEDGICKICKQEEWKPGDVNHDGIVDNDDVAHLLWHTLFEDLYPLPPVKITLESIAVTKQPTKVTYYEGETFDPAGMEITATYSNETTKVVSDVKVTGGENLAIGTQTVTVSYTEGEITKTATVEVTVKEIPTLESIAVTKQPTKVIYTEGENFDAAGMEITATYSDESTAVITDYQLTGDKNLAAGTQTITISYTVGEITKTATVEVTVKEIPVLSSIAVTKQPTKVTYTEGENFDAAGMEITATYSDDSTKVVTDVKVTGDKNLAVGTQTITVSYTEGEITKTTTVEVTVTEIPVLSSISVTKQPTKVTYTEGETFSAAGMEVTANYSNGTKKVVTDYKVSGGNMLTTGTKSITVSYTEDEVTKTATVNITVNKVNRNYNTLNVVVYPYIPDVPAFKATLTEMWGKMVPDVTLNYIEWDCYMEPTFPSTADVVMYDSFFTTRYAANNNIRTISYDNVEDRDDILDFTMDGATYNNKLYGIPFLACSNFLFYREGDTEIANAGSINELSSVIAKRYSSNKNNGLYSDYDTMIPYFYLDAVMDLSGQYNMFDTAPNLNNPDQNAIAVLRNMYDVQAPNPTGYNSNYVKAEAFDDGKGSALIAYSEAASVMENKDDLVISTISFSDTQNIQIYYADIVSMTSRVTDAQKQKDCLMLMNLVASAEFLEEVCFASEDPQYLLPTRISLYDVAAQQDPLYEQLRELVLDENNRVSRFGTGIYNYLDEGYGKLISAVQAYTPSTTTLSSIAVTKQPTKTTYTEGENFNSAGMTVTATYSNGTKKAVTGYKVTGGENLAVGTQNITITYTEGGISKTATVTVTVAAKPATLSSIAVSKQPTKTTYTAGENFDGTGMEITATYSDGTTKVVSDVQVTGGNALTAGTQTITVSYTEGGVTKTATLTVTVEAKVVTLSSIAVTKQPTKTTYTEGDNFDAAGMVITANYSDGTTQAVTGYTVTGDKNLAAGTQTITVSYTEGDVTKTATLTVTVEAKVVTLSSIAVTKQPTKTTYTEGDSFDSAGMQVTATYSDNTTKVVTGYEVSGGNKMSSGSKTITISYTEGEVTKTTTLTVTVNKVNRNYSSLNVAIFPWIPDETAFKNTMSAMWKDLVPDVTLNFVNWDCYYSNPPTNCDIIMYDAMFTTYWANAGQIQSINASDVEGSEDILPFALEGAYHNNKLYGIPYLACSNFLIYREGDTELANVDSINELNTVLAKRYKTNKNQGLLTDFEAGLPYFYLDGLMDLSGKYDLYNTAPNAMDPDSSVMSILTNMYNVLAPDKTGYYSAYARAEAFNDGHGSALLGYSETIAYMPDIVDDIVVTALSFSDTQNIQLYYADIVSMTSRVTDAQKKKDCLLLMNLIASAEFQEKVCFDSAEPQYLLPARISLYNKAAQTDPIYKQLRTLVLDSNNKVARFGTSVYDYLNEAGNYLLGYIYNPWSLKQ